LWDKSAPCDRRKSRPSSSDFRSSTANAIWRCSTSPSTPSFGVTSIRVDDIAVDGHVGDRATIVQHKTGRLVQVTDQTRASPQDWLTARPADRGPYVFLNRSPQSAKCDGAPIRAHRARLDRGRWDRQQRVWHEREIVGKARMGDAVILRDVAQAGSAISSLRNGTSLLPKRMSVPWFSIHALVRRLLRRGRPVDPAGKRGWT
jgi:hypothetical protein